MTFRTDETIAAEGASGEREYAEARATLANVAADRLLAAPADPRRAALTCLLAVRLSRGDRVAPLLRALARAGRFDLERLDQLEKLARVLLHVHARASSAHSLDERAIWVAEMKRAWTVLVPIYSDVRTAEAMAGVEGLEPLPGALEADVARAAATVRPHARQHPRVHLELEVTLESDSNFYMGITENLSEGGLFVATYQPRPVGSHIAVKLRLPDDEEIVELRGEVRWVREYRPETKDVPPGMGIRFGALPENVAARVRAFVETRAPIFYDD